MPRTFAISLSGRNLNAFLPGECPICHSKITIGPIQTIPLEGSHRAEVLFQCNNQECLECFLGYYSLDPDNVSKMNLVELKPKRVQRKAFEEVINTMSPRFVMIYEEALQAQENGLEQIAGPGYRKAFEFLVKDYAKSLPNSDANVIEKTFSGNVVDDYLKDVRIKQLAKRTLWLGNDETHYLRIWGDKDISDLIRLIDLTLHHISMEYLSREVIKEMPDPKDLR